MQIGILNFLIEAGRRRREGRTYPPGTKVCVACKGIIEAGTPRTKQMGLCFHRKCWREQQKG